MSQPMPHANHRIHTSSPSFRTRFLLPYLPLARKCSDGPFEQDLRIKDLGVLHQGNTSDGHPLLDGGCISLQTLGDMERPVLVVAVCLLAGLGGSCVV